MRVQYIKYLDADPHNRESQNPGRGKNEGRKEGKKPEPYRIPLPMEVVARFVRNVLNGGDVGVILSCVVYGGC